MAGHSAFGNDLIKHVALGNTAIKKIALGNDIVWSGASLVSYYDGATLLGTEEVDEGEDVLRPSAIVPTKTNYTHVGWSTSNGGERVTTLVATGEPMNLYAVFVPNTLVIASYDIQKSTDTGGYHCNVINSSYNSDYLTAEPWMHLVAYPYNTKSDTHTFTLDTKYYQTVTATEKSDQNGTFFATKTVPIVSESGTYTISASIVAYGDAVEAVAGCVITLSNPEQWE